MNASGQRGIALVLALFLMSAMSLLATSLMFLSQTEIYATMNYRMMSQARYAAEAGVQKAANFLFDAAQYSTPSSTGADLLSAYDTTKSPVECLSGCPDIGGAVRLSWDDTQANYPVSAVQAAFRAAFQGTSGTLTAGNATLTYQATATLLAMQKFESYGGGEAVVQTWEITGDGSLSGARPATVEVVSIVETPKVSASTYGAFATDNTCGALTFSGNVTINSYDSTSLTGSTSPTLSPSGGHVGTNGNLSISGSVEVQGNLYTPRTGVGACEEGSVTALTETGHAEVTGSVVQLPTAVSYPTPALPNPLPDPSASVSLSSANVATACTALAPYLDDPAADCSVSGSGSGAIVTIAHGGTLPNLSISSQIVLELTAGSPAVEYAVNSLSLSGSAKIRAKATASTESILVNVAGKNPDGSDVAMPIDFTGGTYAAPNCAACSNYDASLMQIVYAGTGEIKLTGNSAAAATIYAPNAQVTLSGTADVYGSVLARRMHNTGNANIHYDRRLQRDFYVSGHPMASSFTWRKY